MGRPLFSHHHHEPAVRVEPEQPQQGFEKWTYWNAFDPDSDEFFESSDAVYEAFVPADGTALPPPPALIEVPASSSSSEASSSGRGSPAEAAGRDLSTEEIDLALRREAELIRMSTTREDEIQRRVREAREAFTDNVNLPLDADPERILRYVQGLDNISRQGNPATQAVRERVLPPSSSDATLDAAPRLLEQLHDVGGSADAESRRVGSPALGGEPVTTARGIPVAVPATIPFAATTTHPVTDRPSTPPHTARSLSQHLSTPFSRSPALDISPPPSVTPRLYSWSSRAPIISAPASPGPLRNRDARLSVEHISPLPDASPSRARLRPNGYHTAQRGAYLPNAPHVDLGSWIVS